MPDGSVGRLSGCEDATYVHDRTSVYTRVEQVDCVLDAVGWKSDADLSGKVLVEPCAGNGAFLVVVAKRLVESTRRRNKPFCADGIAAQVLAWELNPAAADEARAAVREVFRAAKLSERSATYIADSWVRTGDFLLADIELGCVDVVVGNPPYMRWSRIPAAMRRRYETTLPRDVTRGDLLLPFLDRGVDLLMAGGRLGFVISDRWLHAAYAASWRERAMPHLKIRERASLAADVAFETPADAYAERLIIERRSWAMRADAGPQERLIGSDFEIRVGPALGCTPAYVLSPDELDTVEPELLRPWIDGREVQEGAVHWGGRKIITLYDVGGGLIDLAKYPKAEKRLARFGERLKGRSIITKGAGPWWRPIDRLAPDPWSRPKLLLPELAKTPRIAYDGSGMIPSHGVYAIFHCMDDETALRRLYRQLQRGGLARALEGKAPKVKGGYVRCYKSILRRI